MEIKVTNVNQAVDEGFHWLAVAGVEEQSRNGAVLVSPEPVLTVYTRPTERVLFSPLRDANPFFHLMESLWMLAGRNDIAFPTYFNKHYTNYSDDGRWQWGAYGFRWRKHFGCDQLALVVEELRRKPESRRAVLEMWDAGVQGQISEHKTDEDAYVNPVQGDLGKSLANGVDVPCNTHAYIDLRGGVLNLTVLCRSNDALWGAYGANVVHFSALQEYLAAWLGVPVGTFYQFSNNYHVYPEVLNKAASEKRPARELIRELAVDAGIYDYYKQKKVRPFKLVNTDIPTWDEDLRMFFGSRDGNPHPPKFKDVFFSTVVWPMWRAWRERKDKAGTGLDWARLIGAEDWRKACVEWIVRRENRKEAK